MLINDERASPTHSNSGVANKCDRSSNLNSAKLRLRRRVEVSKGKIIS
jgi:hypothetical protein